MEKAMSLYSISNRFIELWGRAQMEELTEAELQEQEQELSNMLVQKTPGLVAYDRNLSQSIIAVQSEIERLTALKKDFEKQREKYAEYVKSCMERLDITKIETDLGKIVISKNPTSIEILDLEQIPEEYVRTTVTIKGCKRDVVEWVESAGIWEENGQVKSNGRKWDLQITFDEAADKTAIGKFFKETGCVVDGTFPETQKTKISFK